MLLKQSPSRCIVITIIVLFLLTTCKKESNNTFNANLLELGNSELIKIIKGDEANPFYRVSKLILSSDYFLFTETNGNRIYSYSLISDSLFHTGGIGKGPGEFLNISNIYATPHEIIVIDLASLIKRKYSYTLKPLGEMQSQYGINTTQFYSAKKYDIFVGMFVNSGGLYAGLYVENGEASYIHKFNFRYPSFCYSSTIDTTRNRVYGKYCFGKEIFVLDLNDLSSTTICPNDRFVEMVYEKIISKNRSETMTNYASYLKTEKHSFTNGMHTFGEYLFYSNLIEDPIGELKKYIIEIYDTKANTSLKSIIIDEVLRYFIGADSQYIYTAKFEKTDYGTIYLYRTVYK